MEGRVPEWKALYQYAASSSSPTDLADTILELEYLVANPLMQRRGAGSRLLTWGVEQADKQNVLLCLESTPLGVPLYERFGFQEVAVIKDDMKKFGWNEPYDEEETRRVFMIRQPHTLN